MRWPRKAPAPKVKRPSRGWRTPPGTQPRVDTSRKRLRCSSPANGFTRCSG